MPTKQIRTPKLTWVNIDEVNKEALDYLKQNYQFHPLDIKDVMSKHERPKLDVYKNYLFLVFHFPEFESQDRKIIISEINVFLGKDFLITVQKRKFKAFRDCFYKTLTNPKIKNSFFHRGSGYLLYRILDELFNSSLRLLDNLGRRVDLAEERVYRGETKDFIADLAQLRRDVLTLRRIIDPQRLMIGHLMNIKSALIKSDLTPYFDDVVDTLNNIWVLLENYREMIEGLFHTNESLLSHKINQVIKMLTIISVGLLPLTLLTGFYGMNVSGLPFVHQPAMVWTFFGVLALIILSAIGILKLRKFF